MILLRRGAGNEVLFPQRLSFLAEGGIRGSVLQRFLAYQVNVVPLSGGAARGLSPRARSRALRTGTTDFPALPMADRAGFRHRFPRLIFIIGVLSKDEGQSFIRMQEVVDEHPRDATAMC